MNKYIQAYLNEVNKYLSKEDQDEVTKELTANIYDMLHEDDSDDEQVKEVLNNLGDPVALASSYSTKPNYLISPRVYPEYIITLKKYLPMIMLAFAIITNLSNIFEVVSHTNVDGLEVTRSVISSFISGALNGLFQGFAWITIGFVIYDRNIKKANSNWEVKKGYLRYDKDNEYDNETWTADKLDISKENIVKDEKVIPLSTIIGNIISTLIGLAFILALTSEHLPFIFNINHSLNVETIPFSPEFMHNVLIFGGITGVISLLNSIYALVIRRYTPKFFIANTITNIVSVIAMIIIFTTPNILFHDLSYNLNQVISFQWYSVRNISIVVMIIVAVVDIYSVGKKTFK